MNSQNTLKNIMICASIALLAVFFIEYPITKHLNDNEHPLHGIAESNSQWFGNIQEISITKDTLTDTYIVRDKKLFWKFDHKKMMKDLDDDMTIDMKDYPTNADQKVCSAFISKLRTKYKGRLTNIVNYSVLSTQGDTINDELVVYEHIIYTRKKNQ